MRPTDRLERYGGILRIGMIVLIVPQAVAGFWAFVAPRSFYETFPGFGREWVAPIGDYNAHFIADTGNLLLVLCLLLAVAAFYLERRLVRVALSLWLVFAVPHFISHVQLTEMFDGPDNVGNLVTLGIGVLLPILLLILTWRDSPLVGER
jgi:DMSO/TMAO reductase YedYZ heme-binding membrane subunit